MNQYLSLKIIIFIVSLFNLNSVVGQIPNIANDLNLKKTCQQTINYYHREAVEEKSQQQFLREKILTPAGELREDFVSQEGLMLFTKKYFKEETDLSTVFHLIANILPKPLFDHLKWKLFYGSIEYWEELKSIIKNPIMFIDSFKDMEGYVIWTERYFNGDMEKAFLSARALVSRDEVFEHLNWNIFYGSLSDFEHFKDLSFSKMGKVYENLKGMGGYIFFSLNITGGDMKKAYLNTKAVLSENLMRQLGWLYFDGTLRQFEVLKKYIKTKGREDFIEEFKEASGLSAFVGQYHYIKKQKDGAKIIQFPYRNRESKAINNVSFILGNYFEKLKWEDALDDDGRARLDIILRGILFKPTGGIRVEFVNEFKGMEGYLIFSDKYFNGDMFSAFEYAKHHLRSRFYLLRWKNQFFGMTKSFKDLREKILNTDKEVKKRFKREKGLLLFSNLYFNNNKLSAYSSVSGVLDSSVFNQLKWRNPFSLENLKPLRSILWSENGRVVSKWKTMDGYLQLALEYRPNRNMQHLFDEVILLGGRELIRQLKWKIFYGYIGEFQNLQKLLDDDLTGFLEQFNGLNGQILFAERYYASNIDRAFKDVFALLDKKYFDRLKWKGFEGITSDELSFIYDLIFDENGSVKEEFIEKFEGIDGQMLFSEKYSNVNMYQSYLNVSLLLGDENFWRLKWKRLQGSIDDLKFLIENLLDEDGSFQLKYRGRDGYLLFCESYFPDKDMSGVYKNALSLIGKKGFHLSGWLAFKGLPDEFKALRNRILQEDGSLKNTYRFTDGMVRLATHSFQDNLQKTYENTYSVIPVELFEQLKWKKFYGSVSEFQKFQNIIFEKNGTVSEEFIDEFQGMEGLAMLSGRFKLNMLIIARNVASLLQETDDYIHLGWKSYDGFKSDFERTQAFFFLPDGSLKPNVLQNYRGNDGMSQLAERFEWRIKKTFYNILAVLPPDLFEELNWILVPYTPKRSNGKIKLENLIFNEEGQVRENFIEDYKEMDGLSLMAREFFEGNTNMMNAFATVSALMKNFKSDFKSLNWRKFYGDVQEYETLKALTLNEDGSLKKEFVDKFKGMEGYAKFASDYYIYHLGPIGSALSVEKPLFFKSYMYRAFINVSAVTNPFFDQMEWRVFQGSVEEFKAFKNHLLNPDGSVKSEFKGMDQMARFADLQLGGNMTLVYRNASSLFGGARRLSHLLGWGVFYGQSSQFYSLLEDFDLYYPEGWIGPQGQKRIADKIFQGNQTKLKKNVSSLRGRFFGEGRIRKTGRVNTKQQAYFALIKNEKFNALNWQ